MASKPAASPKELFLSYGREREVLEFVKRLKQDLEADGFGVWLDQDDIPAGCDWHAAIGSGLEQCKALLAVVTPKYVTSRYCTSELYVADGDQKSIFPIFFADTDLSSGERARGVKYVISGINWTMFRPNVDDYDMSLEKLKFGLRQHDLGSTAALAPGTMASPGHAAAAAQGTTGAVTSDAAAAEAGAGDSLASAVDQMTLYSAPLTPQPTPSKPTASESQLPSGSAAPVPSAPPALGADDVDGTGLPSYESSLLMTTVQSGSSTASPFSGHSPSAYPGQYPAQVGDQPRRYPSPTGAAMATSQSPSAYMYAAQVAPPWQNTTPGQTYYYPPYAVPPGQQSPYPPSIPGYPAPMAGHAQQRHPPPSAYTTPTRPAQQPVLYSDNMATPAYRHPSPVFPQQPGGFSVGQRLEAVDRMDSHTVCVSTIVAIADNGQLRINFDGYGTAGEYWCDAGSPDIHPVGWAANSRKQLRPPPAPAGVAPGQFDWHHYLSSVPAQAAPHHLFTEAQRTVAFTQPPTPARSDVLASPGRGDCIPTVPNSPAGAAESSSMAKTLLRPNMALEVDDPNSPSLTYPCRIQQVNEGQNKLCVHYEGWESHYDFWVESSSGILHPPHWCQQVGRTLQKLPSLAFSDWESYTLANGLTLAQDHLFNDDQRRARPSPTSTSQRPNPGNVVFSVQGLRPGMAVELDDPAQLSLTYICTIIDVDQVGQRVLLHYEGWNVSWDFWIGVHATAMHHMGWCASQGRSLIMPGGATGDWQTYLTEHSLTAATKDLFDERKPASMGQWDRFVCGHALEITDPASPTLTYLGSVVDVRPESQSIRVTYVGWANRWDFDVDLRTNTGVHPIGWCQATGRSLILPGSYTSSVADYLKVVGMTAAPASLFASCQKQGMPGTSATFSSATTTATPATPTKSAAGVPSIYQVCAGMRLEAVDRKNPSLTCVASIKEVNDAGNRVEIYFDGWSDSYNYWCDLTDKDIHPVGWCAANHTALQPPHGLAFGGWESYLARNNYKRVPIGAFTNLQKSGMITSNEATAPLSSAINNVSVGMRLEAVDIQNPSMTCVASISAVDVRANTVEIYFDGWSTNFNYWCKISDTNIHPMGWCGANGIELNPPHGIPFTNWSSYLSKHGYRAVPKHVFTEAQCSGMIKVEKPAAPTACLFKVGMRLEAVDRQNASVVCVASIASVDEAKKRVEVHFDGWSDGYNYWCSSDNDDIHPIGWCEQNGKAVTPPHNMPFKSWESYLCDNGFQAAPFSLFTSSQTGGMFRDHLRASSGVKPPFLFARGMRLEAKDKQNPSMVCAANVIDVSARDQRIQINFDGWSSTYDYWCSAADPDIHPIGWCHANGVSLHPPKDLEFKSWVEYLYKHDYVAVPFEAFTVQQTLGMTPRSSRFSPGMRLEARDRLNPHMMCVARISGVEGSSMLIAFDGWSEKYDYWCSPDSDDIHPVGWCDRFGFQLQPPKGRSSADFNWRSYLQEIGAVAAPKRLFTDEGSTRVGCFMKSMKLEAKDPKNPGSQPVCCVASIAQVREGRLLIHFDGRSNDGDYWCERSSPDIHPIGWCAQSGLELCKPPVRIFCQTWRSFLLLPI
eukprot:scpid10559/ scgid4377/ Lethal(3)malignant brain tumor-like protein 1; L(3)mbt protein homolog; L3MBTL1